MNELLRVEELKKWFPVRLGFMGTLLSKKSLFVRAVDGISFDVKEQEIFGLVGESGSGKTTTGRTILRLTEPTGGKVFFKGKEVTHLSTRQFKHLRREMQIIFQDPYESLNPKMTVYDIIAEPLTVQGAVTDERDLNQRIHQALEDVQLVPPEEFLRRYPHELSGGMKQRVCIAMAISLRPQLIIADEPTSALDVVVQRQIMHTLRAVQERLSASVLLVGHDMGLMAQFVDRIGVMYGGRLVEVGSVGDIFKKPLHPYTQLLISSIPSFERKGDFRGIPGQPVSLLNPPTGCLFHPRCPKVMDRCSSVVPQPIEVRPGQSVACLLYATS